jgi:hypothetical protein
MRLAVASILGLLAVRPLAEDLAERAARSYLIDTSGSTAALAVGERGALVVTIRFQPGVHAQTEAPLRATLTASPGVALARDRLGWPDVVGPRSESPRLEVPFTASAPGQQTVKVRLEFFACSSSWCAKQDREAVLGVAVELTGRSERGRGEGREDRRGD